MGCLSWLGDPVGNLFGIKGAGDIAGGEWWNLGDDIKEDWRKFKHFLVPDMRRDREQTTTSATTARRIIYGQARVSGQLVFAETTGDQSQYLHMVFILAGHAVASFGDVYLDDKLITDGVFSGKVTHELFDGTQTTACASLVSASSGLWTSNHKLLGCAYIYLRLTWDENAFPAGIPSPKVVVNGKKVYDPRTGLTAWSDNPALCARDYMLLAAELGGMGCAASEVDDAAVIVAANICDELVAKDQIGGTEKRYTCNGVLSIEDTPAKLLTGILGSMDGHAMYSQGAWRVFAGKHTSPVATLDESWLNGAIDFKTGSNKNDKLNTVTGTFVDPTNMWAATGFPTVANSTYKTQDGGEELSLSLTLNYTISGSMAQRLAKRALEKSRRGVAVTYPCNLKAFSLQPNDVVRVNNTLLGWSEKLFRVLDWRFSPQQGVNLTLGEEDPKIDDWVPGDITTLVPPALTNLPNPYTVPTPTGLDVAESLYTTNVASVVKARAVFSWVNGNASVRTNIVTLDGVAYPPTADTQFVFDDIAPGPHTFTVQAVNSLGAVSGVATLVYTTKGKTAKPNAPGSVAATVEKNFIRITWALADLDTAVYKLRLGSSYDSGVDIGKVAHPGDTFLYQPLTSGNLQFWLKATDTSDGESTNASASPVITIAPPNFAVGAAITPQVIDNNVLLKWPDAAGTYPVEVYEIRKGLDFATASVIGHVKGTFAAIFETASGTFKYWVVAKDTAGLYGTPLSVYSTVSQPPGYELHDQRQSNFGGTKSSCIVDLDGSLVCLVNTAETFEQHFQNQSITTPQQQIDAGKPLFIQSGVTSAYYEETVDYGAAVASTKITMDVTRETPAGTVTITPKISVKLNAGDAWTDYDGQYTAYATNFRYVKYRLDFATSNDGVLKVSALIYRLDLKQKTKQGTATAYAADSGGTVVDITGEFIDVRSITLTPLSTSAVIATYDFTDAPYPTQFKALMFNTSGSRVDCPFSYTIDGV